MADFDYKGEHCYFITAVTKGRFACFGNVVQGKMVPSPIGEIVIRQWDWLFCHFPYIRSLAFQLMPDHIHGVIEVDYHGNPMDDSDKLLWPDENGEVVRLKVKPLYDLVGAFKMTSSKEIHLAGLMDFAWQRSFHDRIIRNDIELGRIVEYIETNPLRWEEKYLLGGTG